MPKEFTRTHRLSQQLQREIAVLIQNEIKDPRINFVTVQDVAVSKDLSIAKVYASSVFGRCARTLLNQAKKPRQ